VVTLGWVLVFKRPFQIGSAAALLVASVSIFFPNYYKSEARVLPVEAKGASGGLGNLSAAAAAFGVSVPGGDGNDANFVDILNSRTLKEKLLQSEFTFKANSWRFGPEHDLRQTLGSYLREPNLDKSLGKLNEMLGATRDLKSKVITISAETESPTLSQQVVQRWVQLLEAFAQEKGRTRGGAKATFAEARLKEARQELSEIEQDFLKFLNANRNYALSSDPSVRLTGIRLDSEMKLRQQLVMTLAMNREQALMEEKNDIPIVNILDVGNLPIEKSRPARFQFTILAFLVSVIAVLSWEFRGKIMASMFDVEAK